MRLLLIHFALHQKATWRRPAAVILNILLPLMIFYSTVAGRERPVPIQEGMTVAFMAFAILGVMFYQFGALVAEDRHTNWSRYVSLLAARNIQVVAARVLSGVFIALISPFVLYVFALYTTSIGIRPASAMAIIALLTVGAIPFALIGLSIALYFSRSLAVSLAQFVYYPLVYMGGLWSPGGVVPDGIASISHYLPTRKLGELGWGMLLAHRVSLSALSVLGIYSVFFGVVAVLGVRRRIEREV